MRARLRFNPVALVICGQIIPLSDFVFALAGASVILLNLACLMALGPK